jgi:Putative zincin peptidase
MIVSIVNKLILLVTAPGIIVHEIAHRFFCDVLKIDVYKICYFSLSSKLTGSVVHKRTRSLKKAFLIAAGPLIINTLLCALCTFPLMTVYTVTGTFLTPLSIARLSYLVLAWLGFSIGFHAWPSNQDISNILVVTKYSRRGFTSLLIKIATVLLVHGARLRYIGLDMFYAYCIAKLLPFMLLR